MLGIKRWVTGWLPLKMSTLTIEITLLLQTHNFVLRPDTVVTFHEERTGDDVRYQSASDEDKKSGAQTVCIVRGSCDVDADMTTFFGEIAEHKIPSSVEDLDAWSDFIVGSKGLGLGRPVTRQDRLDPQYVIRRGVLPPAALKI